MRITPFREGVTEIDNRSRVQRRDHKQYASGQPKTITVTLSCRLACNGAVSSQVRVLPSG